MKITAFDLRRRISNMLLSEGDIAILSKYAAIVGDSLVEIGAGWGSSAAVMLANMPKTARLTSIDSFIPDSVRGWRSSAHDCHVRARRVLNDAGMENAIARWEIVEVSSRDFPPGTDGSIDMIFIDGDHDYDSVRADFEDFWPQMRYGGLILLHNSRRPENAPDDDVFANGWSGPSQLARELLKNTDVELIDEGGSTTVWRKRCLRARVLTTTRPFEGAFKTLQTNAINNWIALGMSGHACVESETDRQIVDGLGLAATILKSDEMVKIDGAKSKPLFSVPITRAIEQPYRPDVALLYTNSDTLFTPEINDAINAVSHVGRFLLVGRRTDLIVKRPIDFTKKNWPIGLKRRAERNGKLHTPGAVNWFAYRPHDLFGEIPPFVVGYTSYDNWMIWRGIDRGAMVVDVTEAVLTVDQTHGGQSGTIFNTPRAKENRRMAGRHIYTIEHAPYRMTKDFEICLK